jgi:uncharacterized protein YbbK (DUF523 family)
MAENILVSACLLGAPCRFDGTHKRCEAVWALALNPNVKLVPVCPEVLGGMSTPREPSERRGSRVFSRSGEDVTAKFELGAQKALEVAQKHGCKYAIFKERSPSCGKGEIYDGSFTGRLIPGDGICTQLLMKNGIMVFGDSEIDRLIAAAGLSD